ncbi:hypothetical protein CC85DRAFT_288891 [Cutaneotrichosporon oleaginosum]|uniref:Uncharacterized protein n=1 Tax=Cutaneotrichosporon oleaginosum TaxID=879819 RepID=A0A0J0XDH5_9TREE|nr:uncharacterized protein CC85DRAFT_288891 [Cutaneotrichosporon oleaginosum]KLT39122.1 hypothetical protein CC85DRAFT_288891 [Cutaneotrichosporon oleaginosum]TXT10462.1 hypothetical protein COLE_04396 [Cutaneotrichosporon oleaginosum]
MPPGPPAHLRLSALQASASLFPPVLPEMTPESLAAAANQYKQPAPPPTLPLLQLPGRHQEPFRPASTVHVVDDSGDYSDTDGSVADEEEDTNAVAGPSCPLHRRWPGRGEHVSTSDESARTKRMSEPELARVVDDLAILVRREFDCWVESCWNEAFHHVFTHSIPAFIISLILAGASPQSMRRQIVHGGPQLNKLFMTEMLRNLHFEMERRLTGQLLPEGRGEGGSAMQSAAAAIGAGGLGAQQAPGTTPGLPRDGVCTHDLAPAHGAPPDDDDHAACLCQLIACPVCLHAAVRQRKTPMGLLPAHLANSHVAEGWAGAIESLEQERARRVDADPTLDIGIDEDDRPAKISMGGKGFVHIPKKPTPPELRRPQVFPHPQMTDVLAVEEHLRWRLKELGAGDPSVISRYGPSTNAPAALEGLEVALRLDEDDDQSETASVVSVPNSKNGRRVATGRVKGRNKTVKLPPKANKKPERKVYLPEEWAKADSGVRNTAIVLTFRHFVKLLHKVAIANSPFQYAGYEADIAALEAVHPVALYRRLTEQTARRRGGRESKAWSECMDRWTEELGAQDKSAGNVFVKDEQYEDAVRCYTRAISLDGKKTVYYTNRALALNKIGRYAEAEADCTHILNKDGKNAKAIYQRAAARVGLKQWREAEADLKLVLRLNPANDSAKNLFAIVKPEVAKLPKQKHEDALNF